MAKSRTQIQKESDARRGIKNKAFNLPLATIADIKRICADRGIAHAHFIVELVEDYKSRHGDT